MTLAERYNAEAQRLMPQHADSLAVDPSINNSGHIDEKTSAGWPPFCWR